MGDAPIKDAGGGSSSTAFTPALGSGSFAASETCDNIQII